MAGYTGSSLRAVQKKLRKIVKDVIKSEVFHSILDSIDESDPALDFMLEDDALDQFGDNVLSFKAAADAAWIYCAKTDGLKGHAEQISLLFTSLLRQEFPEQEFEDVPVTKKRGRASVEKAPSSPVEKSPPRKKTVRKEDTSNSTTKGKKAVVEEVEEDEVEVTITSADKTALKAIITKLSKDPDAEYFLYPVDAEAYPEYYEQIEYPMDLATAKSKIGEYNSVGEALADLRAIWENCRAFNAEGSDILNSAESCSALLETLVEEKFPSEVLPKKKGSRKSKASAEEVVVKVEKAVKTEKLEHTEKPSAKKVTKRKRSAASNTVVQEGWPVNPRTLVQVPEGLALTRSTMKTLLREVTNSEFAAPFVDPVDFEEAPGYEDLISTPMDLTTLRKRITAGTYDSDASLFAQEARLVWENCVLYNDPTSEIAAFAANLGEAFESQLSAVLEQIAEEEEAAAAAAAEVEAAALAASTPKNKPGRKPKAVEEDEEDKLVVVVPRKPKDNKDSKAADAKDAAAEEEAEAKKPASVPLKKMRKILREIYKNELSLPFQEPVPVDEVPGYKELITHPMDLSTVKAQLTIYEDAPGKFLRDMRLIFDNCQKFNVETSELYKTAGTLRDAVDQLYCEAFPPVDPAEELAAAQKAAAKAARKAKLSGTNAGAEQDLVLQTDDDYRPRTGSTASNFVLTAAVAPMVQTVQTVAPVLPPSSGTSAAALAARLPTKAEELEALEKALSDPSLIPSTNAYVRDRAMLKARDKHKAAKVPFVVAPDLYTVTSFGEIQGTHDKYHDHDEHHLYPLGYSVSRKLRIALLPRDLDEESAIKGRPFVDVDLKCNIAFSYAGNPDIFHVLMENGTAISQGPTAREAWAAVIGKEQRIMRSLGGKLQRCRAVFNRLAVSPDALPFLDMVPLTGPVGEQYYAIIKSPMWFREVHSRLVEGTYDVEFDFAWDMRLIFKNCMEYNLAGSELYEAAERLGEAFEQLFTRWVLNTQDGTIEDVAKGPWDKWAGLKYFDFEDPTVNICAETGTRGPASLFLQCRCCEDQNLATLHSAVSHKNDWACPRCVEALQWSNGDLTNSPFCAYINPSTRYDPYSIEEFGGSAFVPAPEFGLGWSQAKRRLPFAGLKNLFLSPLGYEVLKEQIADQAAYEQVVNQNLYAARAVEFEEFAKTNLPRGSNKKKTARHKRSSAEPMSPEKASQGQSSSTVAPAIDPAAAVDEEGRISTGKLYNFTVPEDSKLVWLVCSNEALALEKAAAGQDISVILADRVPLTEDLLPESGFFGLHLPAIRARVEGVPGAMNCAEYRYQDEDKHRDDILKEVRNIRKRQELVQASENTLKKFILEERYRFERQQLTPPVPSALEPTTDLEHKKDFFPLFPPTVESNQADTLLCLWEFLYLTPSLARHIEVYSLHDLVCSLAPPSSALTTYGQIVFDELCCSLADLLLGDLRLRCDPTVRADVKWQEVLMVRPVNIITWPEVAIESLRLLNFPLSVEEMGHLLLAPSLTPLQLLQRDLLTLVFNHPLIDTFLVHVPVAEGHQGPDPNFISTELRKMKDHFSSTVRLQTEVDGIYETAESLCTELRRLFVEIATTDLTTQRLLHSRSIVHWMDGLFARWGVSVDTTLPEDFPEVDDLKDALYAEKLNPWRFWGGYTLSNMELPRTQVLLPSNFNLAPLSDYERRIQALDNLEKTLLLLGRSEPETWSADERTVIYATFIDHCLVTKDSVNGAGQRQASVNLKCGRVTDVPTIPAVVPHFDVIKHSPAGTKCHFTGVEVDHSLEGTVWVSVPPAYQSTTPSDASGSKAAVAVPSPAVVSNGRGTRGSTVGCVALQSALLNVVAAREVSLKEARSYEHRVMSVLQPTLYENAKTCSLQKQLTNRMMADPLRSASYPSQPLGYDRRGNAYWILSVQEASTLFPFHPNGVPLFMGGSVNPGLADGKMSIEPCVLIREPSGWWGFHNFGEINALLGSFSSDFICERVLLLKLIEKLAYTRCWLTKNALNVRVTQRDWIVKRIRAEHAMHSVKFPAENLAPLQMNRFLEIVWSRCVEVRQYLHVNAAYKFEEDSPVNSVRAEKDLILKRSKRLRDLVGEDVFQAHYARGYQRNDFLARLRQTAATTTATQIIADATMYPSFVENAKKSPFLLRNDPMAPPLPVTRGPLLLTAASGENAVEGAVEESKTAEAEQTAMDVVEVAAVAAPAVVPEVASAAPVETAASTATAMEVEAEPVAAPAPSTAVEAVAAKATTSEPMEVEATEKGVAVKEENKKSTDKPASSEDPEAHLIDPNTLIVDLRAFISNRFGSTRDVVRTKAVEVVHLVTGELLRLFPSGKDAAAFFNTSQSGISLCLHNTKADYLGYKWRNYDGPTITSWTDLDAVQLCYNAVVQCQVTKAKRESWDAAEERARVILAVMEDKKLDPAHYKKKSSAIPQPTLAYTFTAAPAPAVAAVVPPVSRPAVPQPVVQAARPTGFVANTHVVLSNEVVGARLLRLKAELLNMFYIMPEKTLRLPELDEAGEKAIADAGAEAANNIRNGIAKLSATKPGETATAAPAASTATDGAEKKESEGDEKTAAPSAAAVATGEAPAGTNPTAPTVAAGGEGASASSLDMSMSNVERLADKAARKAKRRLRRKLSMEKFVKDVQNATTPQQLLDVTVVLEGAIPQGQMYKYNRASLPMDAATFATLARRVYALDRAIAYDEIKGVENNVNSVPVRLRYQFFPRCFQSASCSKFCGHVGKCVSFNDSGSRIPDFQDMQLNRLPGAQAYQYQAPTNNNRLNNGTSLSAAAQLALANQRKAAYLQQLASLKPKDEDLPLEEILSKLLQVRKELDIETITPYVPPPSAVTQFEWI